MPRYISGPHAEVMSRMIDVYIETSNEINEILLNLIDDSGSSDDSEVIPRPMYTREYTSRQYVEDVLAGHPVRAYNCFRLPPEAFIDLRNILVEKSLICDTKHMSAAEQLGIFLRGVAHAHSYRQLCEFFQHSLETISRYFNLVLRAIVSLSGEYIKLPTDTAPCHPYVQGNPQFFPSKMQSVQ